MSGEDAAIEPDRNSVLIGWGLNCPTSLPQ